MEPRWPATEASPLTPPHRSLRKPQAPTACCDGQFLLASALEWPPGFRGHHQAPNQTRALRLISTYPHTSYYLDHDDVALKNFATCFLHQSYKEREHARNWWSCKNQKVVKSFISMSRASLRPPGEWIECNGVYITLEKNLNQSVLKLHQTGHWQKQTLLVWFHWDICPEGVDRVSSKELGDHS